MTAQDSITLTRSTITFTGEPLPELVVPRQVGSVQLLREIGRGGMGVVWLGRDDLLLRQVAVKFLTEAVAGPEDPGFLRFIEGARGAAAVRHPGLTTIYQADLIAGIPYLVMEYVDGPSLSDVLRCCGPFDLQVTAAVLATVADAIGELHEHGVVHQDVKPGNVLLNREGQALVTDFGLSRASLRYAGATESYGGSPPYMAPEMFAGRVSVRSDVYALAVTTFQLLCGELPYVGTPAELAELHRQAPVPSERLIRRGIDEALIDVLERAMHKDALYRYKSARHFLRAIQDTALGRTDTALGVRRVAQFVDYCRNRPATEEAHPVEPYTPGTYYETLAARAAAKRGVAKIPPGKTPGA